MDAIDRLISAIGKSGLKHVRIAEEAGMKSTKLSKIYNRRQVPSVLEFIAIARAIHLDPARLFTDGELVVELQLLREAVTASQRVHGILSAWLPESPSEAAPVQLAKPEPRREAVPVRAAANPNAELLVEYESERKLIPRDAWNRGARIIASVDGDSMDGGADPIADGELAYVKPTRTARTANGHAALVRRGDGLYLKIFEISGHTVRLVSANRTYSDVEIDARGESLQIYGYVVAHGRDLSKQ